ncbi:DHH family phosphoesterase [Haloarchaeobius sp. HRN-SO-5]|uniref:DHH family phosphoesterase n=1 Tax=Haloarchaeobius sp. HRN-SO-5 TaxID=3446118 RepID=UPI003EBE91EF
MTRGRDLYEFLQDRSTLAVVSHNNPDPDSLASAMALGEVADEAGVDEVDVFYSGEITHQQNRAFVNLFDLDLTAFSVDAVSGADAVAFVDHSTHGRNNDVPDHVEVDIVIDHHTADEVSAPFVDHREELGATATILTEYLTDLELPVDERLATALVFAIRRETLAFLRGTTRAEYEAVATLDPNVDDELLRTLTNPAISEATVDAIGDAIENRKTYGSALISHTGRTTERDALPQAADYLSDLEGVQTTVVFGIIDDEVELSGRSADSRVHIGDTLQDAFGDVGSAGGHREMAGGTVPLGLFSDYSDDDDRLVEMVEQIVTRRLVEAMNLTERDTTEE